MEKRFLYILSFCVAICAMGASATTISVSAPVSADPGGNFDAQVFLEDAADLASFEFLLSFDDNFLAATNIASGGLFGPDTFEVDNTIGINSASFSEISLGLAGVDVTTAMLLATVSFSVLPISPAGITALDLNNIILGNSVAVPITADTVTDATITITANPVTVPTPQIIWLLGVGLMMLSFFGKLRPFSLAASRRTVYGDPR